MTHLKEQMAIKVIDFIQKTPIGKYNSKYSVETKHILQRVTNEPQK